MGKSSAPKAPDYKGAAEATADANMQNLQYQTAANRPNITTPWGSQTWSYSPGGTPIASGQSGTSSFDQAGYDAAMKNWQKQSAGGYYDHDNGWVSNNAGPQPTKDQFTTTTPGTPGSAVGGMPGGQWSTEIALNPDLQAALDSQMGIQKDRSQLAEGLMGQVASSMGSPLDTSGLVDFGQSVNAPNISVGQTDFSGLPAMGESIPAFSFGGGGSDSWRQQAQDAVWNLQKPMLEERQKALESQLANQGLARGSTAWEREMRSLRDAEDRAQLSAIGEGRNEAVAGLNMAIAGGDYNSRLNQQGFNQRMGQRDLSLREADTAVNTGIKAGSFNNQNRNQQLQEMLLKRGLPLDEMNSLLAGQGVGMPQMPNYAQAGYVGGPDYTNVANQQYQSALDRYNVNQSNNNQWNQLASSVIGAFMFSDIRLKEDIVEVGLLSTGVRVVHYRYRGMPCRHVGVIAQELAAVQPEAVILDASGFFKVDYSKVKL